MNRVVQIIYMLAIGLFIVIQGGCGNNSGSSSNNDKDTDVAVPVEVAEVKEGDIAAYFNGTATLEAEEETGVVAKVGGVVEKILVEEGDSVIEGQILAQLDDEKLSVQLAQTKENLEKLKNKYERSEELFKKNLVSTEEFQSSKYEYEHQKAAYDLAKLDYHYASIRSPISGVVAERLVKIGNMVLANQVTFRVTSLDPLLAILYVPERQIGKLQTGHPAKLRVDALQDHVYTGHIERISPVVDPTTGTVKVTVEVRDASRKLKPGMFARVNIIHDVHEKAMLVPRDAIMSEDRESSVFVVRDSIAYRQFVNTGYINTTHIEIVNGLSIGDTVVTTGKGSLKDSSKVELIPVSPERFAVKN